MGGTHMVTRAVTPEVGLLWGHTCREVQLGDLNLDLTFLQKQACPGLGGSVVGVLSRRLKGHG